LKINFNKIEYIRIGRDAKFRHRKWSTEDMWKLEMYGFVCFNPCVPRQQAGRQKTLNQMVLPFVLYGRETWTVTLTEERRLRVFENRVLRGIFGPKGVEVTGEWRMLHNGGAS
jgi:hypothetical protein